MSSVAKFNFFSKKREYIQWVWIYILEELRKGVRQIGYITRTRVIN